MKRDLCAKRHFAFFIIIAVVISVQSVVGYFIIAEVFINIDVIHINDVTIVVLISRVVKFIVKVVKSFFFTP